MLTLIGTRHGLPLGAAFFIALPPLRKAGAYLMISKILSGQDLPVDLLATTESFFRDAAEALATAMETTRKGAAEADPKALDVAITALKKSFHDVMDERRRLEKLRKDIVGAVENRELDLADARLEVSRRLACIRAARRD